MKVVKTLTISLTIPTGYEIDFLDKEAKEIKLKEKQKNAMDHIKTDEDVLTDNGYTWSSFNEWCEGLFEYQEADRFLSLLVKSLNGDWIPDFDNPNESKFEPRFIGGSSGFRFDGYGNWHSLSRLGSRFCFQKREHAEHAGTKFTKWYKLAIIQNKVL